MTVRPTIAVLLTVLATGCSISFGGSSPPPPKVRLFDPSPADPPPLDRPGVSLPSPAVTSSADVRQEFVLRTGPRELFVDELHRWSAPPDRLVATAVERALFGSGGSSKAGGSFPLRVVRFELDLTGPRAVVELEAPLLPAGILVFPGVAEAAGQEPEQLADAMAAALGQAILKLRTALCKQAATATPATGG